jgi:hypothetical protein
MIIKNKFALKRLTPARIFTIVPLSAKEQKYGADSQRKYFSFYFRPSVPAVITKINLFVIYAFARTSC